MSASKRPLATLDIECFHNWFLIGITCCETGTEWDFQQIDGYPLDFMSIEKLLRHFTIITFNGVNYDVPMLSYAMQGATCTQLKAANDAIIEKGLKWWEFAKQFNAWTPDYIDYIDASEPTPGVRVSLKQYACRLGSRLVQDSPVDFRQPLPFDHVPDEIRYCRNDRGVTHELFTAIKSRIELRENLSAKYGIDVRSKSDAQMAEAVIKEVWTQQMLARPELMSTADGAYYNRYNKPSIAIPSYPHGTTFKANIPSYVHFITPYMQDFLAVVRNADFLISDKEEAIALGHDGKNISTGVRIPDVLKGRDILIGQSVYRVGIGGLHSQESSVGYRSIPGRYTMKTADVRSYYPSMIKNSGMYPRQLGPMFQAIYCGFIDERFHAKDAIKNHAPGTPEYIVLWTIDGGVKIFLNGTFGKLWSRFSIFYNPQGGVDVTIGGQLSLLMLIERLELAGIPVVSANTDGIEIAVPAGYENICDGILAWWQQVTNLALDTKNYAALFSRDVNNYLSIGFDGKPKRKGVMGESGVLQNKHPDLDICADAVTDFLCKGVPIAQTIYGCKDIKKFVRVRGAKGGAGYKESPTAEPVHCGRAVRWYYSIGAQGHIIDMVSGNKVAGSDAAKPIMLMDGSFPADVDHAFYVRNAEALLMDIGYANVR